MKKRKRYSDPAFDLDYICFTGIICASNDELIGNETDPGNEGGEIG